jgi:hypothetical protein
MPDQSADRLVRQQSELHSYSIWLLAKEQFTRDQPRRVIYFQNDYWCGPKLYKDAPDAP